MRKGMLEYCVLLILKTCGASYPNDLISRLAAVRMIVVEGTLYTLLNRLRKEGKLDYEWKESPKGPPRKYYSLTPGGELSLEEMTQVWDELVSAVDHLREEHRQATGEETPASSIPLTKD